MNGQEVAGNIKRIAEEISRALRSTDPVSVAALGGAVRSARRVFLAGAGRSGLAMRGFAMRLAHMGLDAYVVGETVNRSYGPEDLLVLGSGSGATPGLLAVARKARSIGGRIAVLTIDPASPMAELSDTVIRVAAPSPKALSGGTGTSCQPMGSLFEQCLLIILDAVVLHLMQESDLSSEEMFAEHATLE